MAESLELSDVVRGQRVLVALIGLEQRKLQLRLGHRVNVLLGAEVRLLLADPRLELDALVVVVGVEHTQVGLEGLASKIVLEHQALGSRELRQLDPLGIDERVALIDLGRRLPLRLRVLRLVTRLLDTSTEGLELSDVALGRHLLLSLIRVQERQLHLSSSHRVNVLLGMKVCSLVSNPSLDSFDPASSLYCEYVRFVHKLM